MKFYLPTREECQEIVKNSDAFFIKDTVVEGQNVKLVDYRLASLTDFVNSHITLEENGKTLTFWHTDLVNNKPIGKMSDKEIQDLGFAFFERIKSV